MSLTVAAFVCFFFGGGAGEDVDAGGSDQAGGAQGGGLRGGQTGVERRLRRRLPGPPPFHAPALRHEEDQQAEHALAQPDRTGIRLLDLDRVVFGVPSSCRVFRGVLDSPR